MLTDTGTGMRLAGGRLTSETGELLFNSAVAVAAPDAAEEHWRLVNLDRFALQRLGPHRLMDLLAELQPAYSRALWDFLRLGNPGWEMVAVKPGTDAPHPVGQGALDRFRRTLVRHHGSVDVVLNRLLLGVYHRGAVFCELVLDAGGRLPVDLATPDPRLVRHRRRLDPERGLIWVAGQYQGTRFVEFDRPTVKYLPLDPFPGSPYGRPMGAPALFTSLFMLGLFHDLRRVVANQGWPRHDITVLLDRLKQSMPSDLASDARAAKAWADGVVRDIQAAYAALEPADAWVHTDVVQVGKAAGAVDASSLAAIDGLIAVLERQLVQGLKTMPLLLGLTEGTSEANANRQWEIMAAGVKAVQHLVETPIGEVLTLALQAQGIQAEARLQFAELREAEMMRDQQTRALRNTNTAFEYDRGWISQDEAALATVGHEPDEPRPRTRPGTPPGGADTQTNPDPGSGRAGPPATRLTPTGADEPLDAADPVVIDDDDLAAARAAWDAAMPARYATLLDADVVPDDPTPRRRGVGSNGHAAGAAVPVA